LKLKKTAKNINLVLKAKPEKDFLGIKWVILTLDLIMNQMNPRKIEFPLEGGMKKDLSLFNEEQQVGS
jgi:hypothetical protein